MTGTTAYGKITKCVHARMFQQPTIQSELVGLVPRGTQVMIVDRDKYSDYFYKIVTADGRRGFCMRVFIDVVADYNKRNKQQDASDGD